jgi:hypothetical protein
LTLGGDTIDMDGGSPRANAPWNKVSQLVGSRRKRGNSRTALFGVTAALAVATGSCLVTPATSPSEAAGVYVGAGNPFGVASFASNTGANITMASDYLVGSAGFSAMVGSPGSPPYPLTMWRGSQYRLVVGLPMNPEAGSNSAVLANGAAGDYNSYFSTLAENAVKLGESNIIWRPGWEFDQGLVRSDQDAINYANYYRNIVNTMRSVAGQNFQFSWDGALDGTANGNAWNTLDAYPGDGYVDYIALDFYDTTWTGGCGLPFNNSFTESQENCVWENDQSQRLATLASFASAHGKPIAFPEWGVDSRSDGHGGGDDPYFIWNMAEWFTTHNVSFASYFDFNSGGNSVLADYPESDAAYKLVFG